MCDVFECKTYARMFRERVVKHIVTIAALCLLAIITFFVGVLLILIALLWGDLTKDFWLEIIKTGIGLIFSATSLVFVKEILDLWLRLIPFTSVNRQLGKCDSLSFDERNFICKLAEKFLEKL